MTHNGNAGSPSSTKVDRTAHLSRTRAAWQRVLSYLTAPTPQQHAPQRQSNHGYADTSTVSLTSTSTYAFVPTPPSAMSGNGAAAAAMHAGQAPHPQCIFAQNSPNVAMNAASALELMRTYHMYVRTQKTRWRSFVLFFFALLFFSYCTFRGPRGQSGDGIDGLAASSYGGAIAGGTGGGVSVNGGGGAGGLSSGVGVAGGAGPGGSGAMGINPTAAGVAGGLAGSGAAAAVAGADGDVYLDPSARGAAARRRYLPPPWVQRILCCHAQVVGKMEMDSVNWWPTSNRTQDSTEPNSERGLNVGTPNAASLSVARSQPPWSANNRNGLIAFVSRAVHYLASPFYTADPPPYEQALSAFFRTRQASAEGSCNRCQAQMIEQEVRNERLQYRLFLRENKLRVPMLLYYNRLPVYAMIQHLRLMRVRNYQLLDYVSRADAVLRRPETVAHDVVNDAALHARELDFELTRLSFVFYLQRLHLRALRHADAMRLETFHFLRLLSSTVPTLRQLWTGQDHCSWPGVSCMVVRVPLNLLVDDDHPAVQAFVEDLFSVCRGPDCRQRRCVPPACGAFTQHLTRRLFTTAAPGYWMRWDRLDDTAAMDEMIFPKATPRKSAGAEAAAASQQQGGSAANPFGSPRRVVPLSGNAASHGQSDANTNANNDASGAFIRAGTPTAYESARASRATTSSSRTVWTEQQFAHEHPNLLLAEPTLLVDVDVKTIMEEIVRPATPLAQAAKIVAGDNVDPVETYRDNIERPLIEDLLPMQEKLIRTIAANAPRGLQFGKQDCSRGTGLTIPFTFVMLNLANMGLRGYLPDYYDTDSTYDVSEAAMAAANMRSGGVSGGPVNTVGLSLQHNNNNPNSAGEGGGGEDDERLATRSSTTNSAAAAAAANRAGRPEVRLHEPRSDIYWGRLSRQRMLENRNVTTARLRRSVATVNSVAAEVQRVLRRVEKIGLRNHHEDLAVYFAEVSSLAQFQNERWSAYRWPEAMVTVTNAVAKSASRRLYPIVEDNAFSAAYVANPVFNIDHHVELFGELNPRLVALLSIDVAHNPLLSSVFPRTWLSVPFLQSVRTHGSSIVAPAATILGRTYNQSYYCPPGSGFDEASPYATDARRSRQHVMSDASRDRTLVTSLTATPAAPGLALWPTSVHDRDFVGAALLQPAEKIDASFAANGVEAFFQQTDPLSPHHHLYRNLHAAFDDGFVEGIRRLLTQQYETAQ